MKFIVTKDNIERIVEVSLPEQTKERIKKGILQIACLGAIGLAGYYFTEMSAKKDDKIKAIQIEK